MQLLKIMLPALLCLPGMGAMCQTPIPLDPDVTYGRLNNGFTYYLKNTNDASGKVELRFAVKAGHLHEQPDQWHVAHVLEHCAFGPGKSGAPIIHRLNELGVSTRSFSANTGFISTTYSVTIPKMKKTDLPKFLDVVSDWAHGLQLDVTTIENERGNVLNEIGAPEKNDIYATLNPLTNAGRFGVTAEEEFNSIKHFKPEALVRFYKSWYVPGRQAIVLVGNIDVKEAAALIRQKFGTIPGTLAGEKDFVPEIMDSVRFRSLLNSPAEELAIQKMHNLPRFHLRSEEDYRQLAMAEMYNHIADVRFKKLKISDRSIKSVFSEFSKVSFRYDARVANLYTGVVLSGRLDKDKVDKILRSILTEEERIVRYGFTEAELQNAREAVTRKGLFGNDEANAFVHHYLNQEMAPGAQEKRNLTKKIVNSISADDLKETVALWRNPSRMDLIVKSGKKFAAIAPDRSEILSAIEKVRQTEIAPPVQGDWSPEKPLLTTEDVRQLPSNEKYQQTGLPEIGATKLVLANGIHVLLKPAKGVERGVGGIFMRAVTNGGTDQYALEDYYNLKYAPTFAMASGLGKLNGLQLNAWMDHHGINFIPFTDITIRGFRGQSKDNDLESMLQLMYVFATRSKIDDQIFEDLRYELKERRPDMESQVDRMFRMATGRPPKLAGQKKSIDSLQWRTMSRMMLEQFSGFGDYLFVFSGDFDVTAVTPLIVQYLSALPVTKGEKMENKARLVPAPLPMAFEIIKKYKATGENIASIVSLTEKVTSLQDMIGAEMLRSLLYNRMFSLLREKMGSSYDVTTINEVLGDNTQAMTVSFNNASGKIDVCIDSVKANIEQLKREGPSQKELETVIATELAKLSSDMELPIFWCDYLPEQYIKAQPYNELLQWPQMIKAVTPEKIKELANRLLIYKNIQKLEEIL